MNQDYQEIEIEGAEKSKGEKIDFESNENIELLEMYKKFKSLQPKFCFNCSNETFYKQAKLMENFEYNKIEAKVGRNHYYEYSANSTYEDFSFDDFKVYFSWRTRVRNGNILPIGFDFDKVYINELVNCIGCKDEEDALNKLINFWIKFRNFISEKPSYKNRGQFDFEMEDLMHGFYVISNINVPFEQFSCNFPVNRIEKYSKLGEIKEGDIDEYINKVFELSSHKTLKSKFLENEYGSKLKECSINVLKKIYNIYEHNNISVLDLIIWKFEYGWACPFRNFNLCKKVGHKTKYLYGKLKFKYYTDGTLKYEMYALNNRFASMWGYILKDTEYYYRQYVGFRSLKKPGQYEWCKYYKYYESVAERKKVEDLKKQIRSFDLEPVIKNTVYNFLKENRIPENACKKRKKQDEFDIEEKMEIKFNEGSFEKIREISNEIRDALIIEEEKDIQEEKIQNEIVTEQIKSEENEFCQFINALTEIEKKAVKILLEKQDCKNMLLELAKQENQMLEVFIANINEKAVDTIGDTIIEEDLSGIYEEYRNELISKIGRNG